LEPEEHRSYGGVWVVPTDVENPDEGCAVVSRWLVPISCLIGLHGLLRQWKKARPARRRRKTDSITAICELIV
jgi:hypothetical protein